MIRNTHKCNFCEREFHYKELYDNHQPICEYFYKSKREKQKEDEKIEFIPPINDMYKLIQHMYAEQIRQKEKIERLEQIIRNRRKYDIFTNSPIPIMHFHPWIKQIFVKRDHLMYVFREDIFEGIRMCLDDQIRKDGLNIIPLRSSIEKPNVLYLFTEENEKAKWKTCESVDILHLVEHLMYEFMRIYCEWEDENKQWISSCIENKNQHVDYLCKISGSLIFNKEKRRQELKQWLCKRVLFDAPGTKN